MWSFFLRVVGRDRGGRDGNLAALGQFFLEQVETFQLLYRLVLADVLAVLVALLLVVRQRVPEIVVVHREERAVIGGLLDVDNVLEEARFRGLHILILGTVVRRVLRLVRRIRDE